MFLTVFIESWLRIRRGTPGRRAFASGKVAALLRDRGQEALAARFEALRPNELNQIERMRLYQAAQNLATRASWTPEVVAQDVVVDRLTGELVDLLEINGRRPTTVRGKAARGLLEGGFPDGLPWYIHQKFEEQSLRLAHLLSWLSDRAEQVREATADELVAELAAAHGIFAQLIVDHKKSAPPAFDEVKVGELANHRAYAEAIVQVLAWTGTLPADQRDALRDEVLKPVRDQDEDIAAQLREKQRLKDVDPHTGAPEA